jgi:hypothetical protein
MKLPVTIAAVLLMFAVGAVDLAAQNTSSATQTVTFGVQRSAAVLAANFQASEPSTNEISLSFAIPLKVTAGSDVNSDLVAELGSGGTDRSASELSRGYSSNDNVYQRSVVSRSATLPIAKLRNYKSDSSNRLVITLTE